MKIRDYFGKAFSETQKNFDDFLFKCSYRMSAKDFSRDRKMGFKETVLFMMNMVKKSLQVELNDFIEKVLGRDFLYSKNAYIKARQNIKPELFIDLTNSIANGFYEECDDYKVWNDYRLSAIDGSVLEIPNTEHLQGEFGYAQSATKKYARARSVGIYDVLNKLFIKSKIGRYDISERVMTKELLRQLVADGTKKDLILFDRGFPSSEIISYLIENEIDFVMRSQKKFSKEVINAIKEDQLIKINYDGKSYDVRVLRFILESGEEEILLTSLLDENLTIKEFKKLYFMRWGIEVKFGEIKGKLQIENFTGTTKIAIEQDFYISIYLSNMAELIRIQNDEEITETNSHKELKREYKTNLNLLIGTLKDKFIIMLLEKSNRKRNKILKKIMSQLKQGTVPIRAGRHKPRNFTMGNTKYRMHQKRSL